MIGWTQAERDLLAKAVVYTRRSYFTDAERHFLANAVARLSPTWGGTVGAFHLLPLDEQAARPEDRR